MDKTHVRASILKSGDEYQAWRVETYYHLVGQGWYGHIDDNDACPAGESTARQAWEREDAKALAFINGILSPAFKLQFKAATTLKTMWRRLDAQFQPRGFNQRYVALLSLVQTTLATCDDDIEKYCAKFTQARDEQILANGESHTHNNLSEDNLVTLFIGGLSNSPVFESFILHFRRKESMPTMDETLSLAREEARIAEREAKRKAVVFTTQPKGSLKKRKRTGNCPVHPKGTHDEPECWVLHPEKRPKKGSAPQDSSTWKHGVLSALTVHALSSVPTSNWALDTGASQHFCNALAIFTEVHPCEPTRIQGSTGSYLSSQRGTIDLTLVNRKRDEQKLKLCDVLYIPTIPINLISSTLLRKKGIYFSTLDNTLRLCHSRAEIGYAPSHSGLNLLQLAPQPVMTPMAFPVVTRPEAGRLLWYQRFGHAGSTLLGKTQRHCRGMEGVSFTDHITCEPCHLSKSQRVVSRTEVARATVPFGRVHIDVVGHLTPEAARGDRWVVVITDDLTRHRWSRVMLNKGDAYDVIEWFVNLVKVHHPRHRVLEMVLDRGREFGGRRLEQLTRQESIVMRPSSDYTPEQNGAAESSNKVVITRARSMMLDSGLPATLWPEAIDAAVHVTNRMSTSNEGVPPHAQLTYHLTGQMETTNVSHLRRFGCIAYLHIPQAQRQKSAKFAPRAIKGYMVGYQRGGHTNYRIWNPHTGIIKESPHVTFDETIVYADAEMTRDASADKAETGVVVTTKQRRHPHNTPYDADSVDEDHDDDTIVLAPIRSPQPRTNVDVRARAANHGDHQPVQDNQVLDQPPDRDTNADHESESLPQTSRRQGVHESGRPNEPLQVPGAPTSSRPFTRQSATGNRKSYGQYRTSFGPYAQMAYAMMASEPSTIRPIEPQTYLEATNSPESAEWQASMAREVRQLEDQGTWTVVAQLPRSRKLVRGRWVYKKKLNLDNTVREYKSRWVVKGFMQQEGVDYFDTYAATLQPTTFRMIFSLAASRGWPMYQMDVTGAFLHSLIDSEVYIEPPEGFYPPGVVCHVHKSIYGLKQAPHLWFESLTKALADLKFRSVHSDPCCFTNEARDVFLMVFVDDFRITGPNNQAIDELRSGLRERFTMKDVEPTLYLGVSVERDDETLRVHQAPYSRQILRRFGFEQARPAPTPMTNHTLSAHDGEVDETLRRLYIQAIGSLLFLSNRTRPDLEFAVNFLARFAANPAPSHWTAVKRVFRYLAGTTDLGITYHEDTGQPFLSGYSDADFAGDLDGRRSTSGYVFLLGGGPISWKSQRQRSVTLSTTEAEYTALTETAREAASLRQLLTELGLAVPLPIVIFEDNTTTISLASNHTNHKRSKHIDIRNHYCREQAASGYIQIQYVKTEDQVADGLTKPIGPQRWKRLLAQLRMEPSILTAGKSEGVCCEVVQTSQHRENQEM